MAEQTKKVFEVSFKEQLKRLEEAYEQRKDDFPDWMTKREVLLMNYMFIIQGATLQLIAGMFREMFMLMGLQAEVLSSQNVSGEDLPN